MVKDILNSGFGLPSIGDYYYDSPDLIKFYNDLDNAINPVRRENNGIVARDYYCGDPPELGHNSNKQCYVFGIKNSGKVSADEKVGDIKVDDGDTISVPYNSIITGDEDSEKYIKQTIKTAEEAGSPKARVDIRFSVIDCPELPHFVSFGTVDKFSDMETKTITYDEAVSEGYLVSKYRSFMDEPEKIDYEYDGKEVNPNSTFYRYNRIAEKCNFVKMTDGTWRQYFDSGNNRYILIKADCNTYGEKKMADAGIARDTVANAIAHAEEIRFVVDETYLNKDMNLIKTMNRTNPYDPSITGIDKILDSFFDSYTQYTSAGFNYYGLDSYGRMISEVYVKLKNTDGSYYWVNLNKMVVANSNETEINKYNDGHGSPAIDPASYERLDEKAYADAIYDKSKKYDDRADVQQEIFSELGKNYDEHFSDWTVTIGDVSLFVPPTSIRCVTQSKSDRLPLVRARGTAAKSPQKIQRFIEMTLYFNEDHGINGFEYKTKTGTNKTGKEITYYMNGLRALFAQFKLAPFLPIENDYINQTLGIDAVYLINFTCNTVPNFPKLLQVTLQMSEFEYQVYMPEIPCDDDISDGYKNYFAKQINYPLLRYYYQRLLIRGNELKDTPFMDKEYIENTFGNKTALIPMKFMNPRIRFYVPNRAQLEKMLATKKARLTQPASENFTDEMFAFAEDIDKVKNELDYINGDGMNPVNAFNAYVKRLNGKTVIVMSNDEDQELDFGIRDNGGLSERRYKDEFLEHVKQLGDDYFSYLSSADIKNANGDPLITGSATTTATVVGDDNVGITDDKFANCKLRINIAIPLNTPYISENDMKSIRTACSAYSDNTSKEVFEDRCVNISFEMNIGNRVELGENCNGFSLYKNGDYAAVDYLANKVLPMRSNKGNDESNRVKQLIDYVSPDSIKFDAYNEEEDIIVEAMNMGVSNSFSQITLQETNGFAPQYMGGTDTDLTISLYTKSKQTASAMNFLPSLAAEYAREFRLVLAAWPLRIESEFTKFFGITEVMVENVEVDTVPNYPGIYHVTLNLISVDRTIRNREALTKADLEKNGRNGGNFHSLTKEGLAYERNWNYQFMNDYLAEAELYPDLELPTLEELSDAGFRFIRYSNKARKLPDPDFYFTYSYMLTSELIREVILQGISSGEFDVVDGATKQRISASPSRLSGELQKQVNIEKGWDKSIDEMSGMNEDEKFVARIITDFTNSLDKDRDEVWTIAPTIKVALCEKRIVNHLNDAEKRKKQINEESVAGFNKATAKTENTSNNEKANEENSSKTDSETSSKFASASMEKLQGADGKGGLKAKINKRLDDILSMTIEDMQKEGLETLVQDIINSFNTLGEGKGIKHVSAASNIDKWLEAAADAICSYGNVPYSANLKETKDGKAPWKYKDKYRARVDRYGYWEDIEFDKKDKDYKELLKYAIYNSIRFGYFDFKYYTKKELDMRFGAYGTIEAEFFGKEGEAKGKRDYNGLYLADPAYRFESYEVQEKYVEKCLTDFDYAKVAFFRICLLYLKVLISYDILPSFAYDVFREAVMNKERMEKVLKRINRERKTKEAAEEEEYKKQRARALQTNRKFQKEDQNKDNKQEEQNGNNDNKTEQGDKTEDSDKDKKETTSASAGAVEAQQVEQYLKEFEKDREAIDNGKIFLALLMGVIDGNHEFVKILNDRNHVALKAASSSAMKSTNLLGDTEASAKYVPKLSAFIRALGGEGVIDPNRISAGDSTGPANVFAQIGARKNVAAASADPDTYLIHSFYDMIVNDCRGRMLRAFPTFYMVLVDEGRKIGKFRLHDNFYNTQAISSITISKSRKIPTDTAEIVMSNFFKSFTTDDEDLNMNYTANFTDVFDSIWIPILRDYAQSYAEKEERKRTNAPSVERVHLRAGARVHLRIGYGSDASHLPISFNGMIAELETGEVIKLICQSDGAELAKPIMLDRQAYELPGIDQWFGAASMCETGATPRTILNSLLNCHDGKINSIIHDLGYDEAASFFNINTNPLGIYHFGNPDVEYAGDRETMQNIFEVGVTDTYARYIRKAKEKKESENKLDAAAGGALGATAVTAAIVGTGGTAIAAYGAGAAIGGLTAALVDDIKGVDSLESSTEKLEDEDWTDKLMNFLGEGDVIPRLNFDVFGKTVWDVANICRSVDPEYICDILPFHMRSTLFFGRSNDYYAYDYAIDEGGWVEKRKPYQQYHIYSSYTDIINNNIAVSTKNMKTCAVGLYTVSGFMNADVQKRTDPQWIDASIYPEYQKTMYVDTKLYGSPSRKLGVISDVGNWVFGGLTNSFFDRAFDDEGDVKNHHETAVKMTRSALKMAAKEMYQGRITVIGDPSIKPNDRMCITDSYNGVAGQCLARDVVHVFSCDDGYKTVITPDLITAQVGQDAANELQRQSALTMPANAVASTIVYAIARTWARKAAIMYKAITGSMPGGIAAARTAAAGVTIIKEGKEILGGWGKSIAGIVEGFGALKKAAGAAGTAVSVGTELAKGAWSIFKNINGGPIGIAATVLGLGTLGDMVSSYFKSRKCLVIFPLQKYGRPMVGGIDGNIGSVYGAPNFYAKDGIQKVLDKIAETPVVKQALGFVSDILDQQVDNKVNEREAEAQKAMDLINRSHIGGDFTRAYFNPTKPRYDVSKKDKDDYNEIIQKYAVKENTEEDIRKSNNFRQNMFPVIREPRLKRYLDLGYFRVAAHEKGFSEVISDKIKYMELPDPESNGFIPINAIIRDDGNMDVPFLNRDAVGVLCEIIKQSYNRLPGTENERDIDKWYEDNKGKFVTLTSALICGATKKKDNKGSYEATGFSFVLTASDGSTLTALKEAVDNINTQMKNGHEQMERIPEAVMSSMIKNGREVYIVIHPPKG